MYSFADKFGDFDKDLKKFMIGLETLDGYSVAGSVGTLPWRRKITVKFIKQVERDWNTALFPIPSQYPIKLFRKSEREIWEEKFPEVDGSSYSELYRQLHLRQQNIELQKFEEELDA